MVTAKTQYNLKNAQEYFEEHLAVGDYYAEGLELPGVMADGKTPDECVKNAREAMTAVVAHLLELGETPPAPANGRPAGWLRPTPDRPLPSRCCRRQEQGLHDAVPHDGGIGRWTGMM